MDLETICVQQESIRKEKGANRDAFRERMKNTLDVKKTEFCRTDSALLRKVTPFKTKD